MKPIVWVFIASLVVWGGIFAYLIVMELRLRRLEYDRRREGGRR